MSREWEDSIELMEGSMRVHETIKSPKIGRKAGEGGPGMQYMLLIFATFLFKLFHPQEADKRMKYPSFYPFI